jgi:hypothetical protein
MIAVGLVAGCASTNPCDLHRSLGRCGYNLKITKQGFVACPEEERRDYCAVMSANVTTASSNVPAVVKVTALPGEQCVVLGEKVESAAQEGCEAFALTEPKKK